MKKFATFAIAAVLLCLNGTAQNLKKSVTWENICAHPAPMPVIGTIQPVPSDLSRPSLWSVGCETMDRDYAHFELFKQYVGLTGAGYARLQSGWAKTEQEKGKYDFSWLDPHVDGLIEEGLHPWICLCYGNPVYSEHGLDLNAKIFPDGPIMDAWIKYVKAVVKRYKGKVTMYEVWNEPDNSKALDSYDLYANLFVRTAKAIREVDKDVKIAGFATCSPEIGRGYYIPALKKIQELGGIKYLDYITYHAYWPIPESIAPFVRELREKVAEFSDRTMLLQGETGCPGQLEFGHAMRNIEWNEYSQAKWDLRSMLTHWGLGCPYSVFTMTDLNYGWMLQSFGLLRANLKGETIYMRPKFHAVQHVTSIFTADIHPSDAVTAVTNSAHRTHCIGLEKDGKVIGCALWFSESRPGDSLEREATPVTVNGLDIPPSKTVYVDLLTGNIHKFNENVRLYPHSTTDGLYIDGLPMWDCPVLIINRDYIKINN